MSTLISKASLLMVPSVYEDGTLYNVLPSGNKAPDETGNHNGYDQTRADFTFSRGSNLAATRVNSDGLIEKGRENLLLQSNQFDTTWVNSNTTETSGQEGYDGTNDAWLLSISGGSSTQRIEQSVTNSGVQTFSVYVKKGTLNWVRIRVNATITAQTYFDLENGVAGNTQSGLIDRSIESVGNGWYRCSITFNSTSSVARIYPATGDNNTTQSSGSIYIQDAQLEKGLVATDYIETGSVSAQAGILEDMPRINYDANGENGALLLEPSRTNLITNSEYFGGWTKVDTTLTHNYGISPEGVKNSTRVQFADSTAYMYIAPAGTNSGTYASTIYIKGTAGETIKFGKGGNIATGAMHTLTGDWQRIEHITTDVGLSVHISTYGGSTARDMEIYGCQLEAGSYSSSLIPTHGAAVTRGADSCSVTGVSDVIGQTEGTAYLEIMYNNGGDAGVDASFFGLKNSAGTTYLNIYRLNSTLAFRFFNAGANQFFHTETPTNETLLKIAFAYKANDFALYINGVQEATDTSGSVAGMSQVHLAGFSVGDNISDNYKTILFNERLSNSELADLTT